MKTEDLIGSLVADHSQPPKSTSNTLFYVLPLALLAAIFLFSTTLDMRPDFLEAVATWRYLLKMAVAANIAFIGIWLLFRMARPQHAPRDDLKLLPLALLPLALGIAGEMAILPLDRWPASAIGFRPLLCLGLVPLIALAPLVATLLALRRGAPQSPTAAGAVAGFAAGGMGALIYAFHCNNDSPFYVAIWYLLAIGIVTVIGAGIGRAWLRW